MSEVIMKLIGISKSLFSSIAAIIVRIRVTLVIPVIIGIVVRFRAELSIAGIIIPRIELPISEPLCIGEVELGTDQEQ